MIDFLGIGAQKAGTTWIFEQLSRHPEVKFPAGKEIHFWDQRYHLGPEWWLGLFPADPDRKQGEITPAYALLEDQVVRQIQILLPRLRIFYSVRNPIARAWSSALMALQRAEMTCEEASSAWFIDHFRSAGSWRRGDYLSCILTWQRIFCAEQILVVFLDEIRSNPHIVLGALCRHIGVDAQWFSNLSSAELSRPVFAGPAHDLPGPLLSILKNMYRPRIDELAGVLACDLSHWLDWDGRTD